MSWIVNANFFYILNSYVSVDPMAVLCFTMYQSHWRVVWKSAQLTPVTSVLTAKIQSVLIIPCLLLEICTCAYYAYTMLILNFFYDGCDTHMYQYLISVQNASDFHAVKIMFCFQYWVNSIASRSIQECVKIHKQFIYKHTTHCTFCCVVHSCPMCCVSGSNETLMLTQNGIYPR